MSGYGPIAPDRQRLTCDLYVPTNSSFTTSNWRPQGMRNALRAVHAARNAAGLNGEGLERVGMHDLRHSFVAVALDAGATLAEAAVLARHANAGVTGAIYVGVSEKARAQIATKLTAAGFGA
jgi:integrase